MKRRRFLRQGMTMGAALMTPFSATAAAAVQGPRLTDREFFDAFDLTMGGLEAVRTAVDAGNFPNARRALATYLRGRTSVPWTIDPKARGKQTGTFRAESADAAAAGKITVVAVAHQFPGGEIDWFYNPSKDRPELPYNPEWQWQLNRMGWWGTLGAAYQATGDENYARAWVRQMRAGSGRLRAQREAARRRVIRHGGPSRSGFGCWAPGPTCFTAFCSRPLLPTTICVCSLPRSSSTDAICAGIRPAETT